MVRLLLCAVWIGLFAAVLVALWRPDTAVVPDDGRQIYIAGLHFEPSPGANWSAKCVGGQFEGTHSAWVLLLESGRGIANPQRHDLLIHWYWSKGQLDSVAVDRLPNQPDGEPSAVGGKHFPDWAKRLLNSWSSFAFGQYRDRSSEEAILLSLCDMVNAKKKYVFVNSDFLAVDGLLQNLGSREDLRLLAEFVSIGGGGAPAARTAREMAVALQCSVEDRLIDRYKKLRSQVQRQTLDTIQKAIGRPIRPCIAGNPAEPSWYATVVLVVAIVLQTLFHRAQSHLRAYSGYRSPGAEMPDRSQLDGPGKRGGGRAVVVIDTDPNPVPFKRPTILSLPAPSSGGQGGMLPVPVAPVSIDWQPLLTVLETFADRRKEQQRFVELEACRDIATFAEMLVTRFFDRLSGPLDSKELKQLDELLAKTSDGRFRLVLVAPNDAYDRKHHHCAKSVRVYSGVIGRMKLLRPGLVCDGVVVHRAQVALTI